MPPVLALTNVARSFAGPDGPVQPLVAVNLEVAAKELVVVRGPSGSGKSTLLLVAGGLLPPDAGQVTVAGQDLYALSGEARCRFRASRIGFVFQQFHLLPYLTVLDNVQVPCLAAPHPAAGAAADALLAQFGLAERRHHLPAALSTGERQRVALARALFNRPALLLADEPTGNLDEASGEVVLRALADFAGAGGAVLLVTHDARAARYASRRLSLAAGRLTPCESQD